MAHPSGLHRPDGLSYTFFPGKERGSLGSRRQEDANMRCSTGLTLWFLLTLTTLAQAQSSPADAMWPETSHDFGTVPRGAQLLHRFKWTNTTPQRIEIADVRVSCSCGTVTPAPRVLEPGQSGFLDVALDGRRFSGAKTIHVQLLVNPGPKAVTLEVKANSRQDLVYNPGQIRFDVIPEGSKPSLSMDIEYAGTLDWKITGIAELPDHVEAHFAEAYRRPGQVGYRLTVQLKESAPAGDYKRTLVLKTNDPAEPTIPVVVEATIRSLVSIAPNPVQFGTAHVGKPVQRRFTIRSDRPFQVSHILAPGGDIVPTFASAPGNVQVVILQWTPVHQGDMSQELTIQTTLPNNPNLKLQVQGTAR